MFLTPHLVKVKKNSKSLAKILILFLVRSKMNFLSVHFLDQLERGPIWSLLLVIGLLVMQCSQKQLKIFLIFCMKLGDYKVRDRAGFLKKKSWFGDICKKVSKLAQNQTLIFFLKKANNFFGFWPEVSTKYNLQ